MREPIEHSQRLANIINFTRWICISANGYDIKELIEALAFGEYTLEEAKEEWLRRGQPYFGE